MLCQMDQTYLIVEKAEGATWVESVRPQSNANNWTIISIKSHSAERHYQPLYEEERAEILEWATKADAEDPSWLGNVYMIPFVEPQSAADFAFSALNAYSLDTQSHALEAYRQKLAECAAREAEVEKMRSNSQYMANTLNRRSASELSEVELQIRQVELMDEDQLEIRLLSEEYSQLHESVKSKIAERYLDLQRITEEGEWLGIEEAGKIE